MSARPAPKAAAAPGGGPAPGGAGGGLGGRLEVVRLLGVALGLCWRAGRARCLVYLAITLLAGLLPTATAWFTKFVIDALTAGTSPVPCAGRSRWRRWGSAPASCRICPASSATS
ncbi:hypothetical protein ACFQ60_23275 [Streptomyces zhihengii]